MELEKKKQLEKLINKYSQKLEYYKNHANAYNEHSCRIEYIDPFLQSLGWDVNNQKGELPHYREVIAENDSSHTDRPDYSFTVKGVTKFFIEAKKPSVDLINESESAYQIRKYGWNAKHKIAILTNFEYLLIYDTRHKPEKSDSSTTALYKKYYYKDYINQIEEIESLLSREVVFTGAFDEFMRVAFSQDGRTIDGRTTIEVDELFLEQINEWRVRLGNCLYQKEEKYQNQAVLNDVIQDFINQIVFLRICEDRNLPLYHRLRDTIADKWLLKEELKKLFDTADKNYSLGLFSGECIIFDLHEDVIIGMIEELYYPKNPYLFHIIKPSILGKIYEIFLAEHLIINESGMVTLARKKEFKNRSIVSTPSEIVRYMVAQTLEPICNGKSPKEILKLRIADIACGSGIFLEEIFEYLNQYCITWYLEHDTNHLLELSDGRKKLPLEEKKQILRSCIYGIDLDIHAIEVTKFSLLLKLIEDETEATVKNSYPILPDMEQNIFYGNALVKYKNLDEYESQNKCEITFEQQLEIVPFDWSEINQGEFFDVILGNPPYVSTEDMHQLLLDAEFSVYKKEYQSAYKQFDKYFLFIEKALKHMKEHGRLCYIIPNKFYKIASGKELRKIIKRHLVQLDDFGDVQLFSDKTIYTAIITLAKEEVEEFVYVNRKSLSSLWTGMDLESIQIKNETLKELPWRLTADITFMKMLTQLKEKSVPLSKHANIFNGIQTSAERPEPIYWFSKDQVVEEYESYYIIQKPYRGIMKEYHIEKDILKPYFKPTRKEEKGLNSYVSVMTDKKIIFPYNENGKLIALDQMKEKYRGAYEYLLDHYERLVPRCVSGGIGRDIPGATKETWYQYGRTQAITAFVNTPKLIVGILSKEPMYAYDDQDMLIASGGTAGYCAISKLEGSPYDIEYIQAWLSHPYTEKLLQIMGSDFDNGYTARGTFVLSNLPFVELDLSDEVQRKLYQDVVRATKKIYEMNKKASKHLDKAAKSILIREKERLIAQIQNKIKVVYEYGKEQ